jgi:hypothetical protein
VRPVEKVLDRLEGVRQSNGSWKALCPAHDDSKPSLSVSEGDDGRALLKCFAGCNNPEIVAALDLDMSDLFAQRNGRRKKSSSTPSRTTATVQPCNLKNYAEVKGLPVEFLKKLGLSDRKYGGSPAVRIPYRNENGEEVSVRFRIALEGSEEDDERFKWRTGSKTMLYGLWRLDRIRKAGWVVLVEGESDCHALWYHKTPTLGIPGADTWKERWAGRLEGIERVYVVIEPDKGGQTLKEKLLASSIRDRLHLVDLGQFKDASGLYLSDQENFKERFTAALKDATPYAEFKRAETEATARKSWAECEDLIVVPNILERFAKDLARSGVVGESRLAKLLYLAVTSRFLERPVSVAMKGPSSGGKSYLTERVLGFFPDEAYYALTAMSEHALAYGDEPLSNRVLVLYEAAGMDSDLATYFVRSLLSEGRLRYETVEKTSEGMKPRLIEREGPTGLIVTTTAVKLHPENETRLLSLTVTDTQEQTREVMAALAAGSGKPPNLKPWHALQRWLGTAEHEVSIPYAKTLAALIPPLAVRLRRDFGGVLNLICTHAILHQASRERDAEGHIIATLEDYAVVRSLVADLVSEGVEATVPATVRETVEKLRLLYSDEEEPVTIVKLAEEIKVDKSTAWRRVRTAMDRGYAKNLEDRKGRPAQLVPGDSLPDDVEILPTVERLQGCAVAGVSEGVKENIIVEVAVEKPQEKFPTYPPGNAATVQPQADKDTRTNVPNGRRLTAEEVQRVKRLVSEGMAPHVARAEVLGYVDEELGL